MKEQLSHAFKSGWSIIPVREDKRPQFSWKEFQDRRPTSEELAEWKKSKPPAWAVITGEISGIVIIDFDGDEGRHTMESLGLSPHLKTGSGGYHVYVQHPGHKVATLNGKSKKELGEIYPGLDIRADGGYAVFCGRNSFGEYQWLRDMEPDPLETLPMNLRLFLGLELQDDTESENPECSDDYNPLDVDAEQLPEEPPGEDQPERVQKKVSADDLLMRYIGESQRGRNDAGFNLACQLRDNGFSRNAAEVVMREYAARVRDTNTKGLREPYTWIEAKASLDNVYSRPAREPWRVVQSRMVNKKEPRPEPKEFVDLIPEPSFLDIYTRYASEMTDSPHEFHLAVGLSVLSASLGNKVYFQAWGQPVFPNVWSVILAPSGFFRKSTAMRIGLNLLGLEFRENILPNDFTKERLLENLGERPSGIIPVWEFGAILKSMGQDYNSGLKEMLTEIYDAPFYERQTRQGTAKIERPAVSILTASTIDWVIDRITAGDLNSGFLARFLYWPATQKNGWKGFNCRVRPENLEYLQLFLTNLRDLRGEAIFDNTVKEMYDAWLRCHEDEVNAQRLPPELQGFYTRIATYVLKFAVLYEVAMTQDLEITPEAMSYGIKLAEYLKSHLVKLMEDEIVTTRDGKDLKMIRQIIEREPGIDKSTILRKSKLVARRLNELLETLVQSNTVRVETIATDRRPRQTFYAE